MGNTTSRGRTLAEAIATYGRDADAAHLRYDVGLGAAPLAWLVATLRERLPEHRHRAPRDSHASEREVTVLFVDIRGYTGFSEPRQAEEIFGTVNRYTVTVSQLVQARGGVVVEFHGDGMLAARLQSLTSELDAAVAIDDTTFRRAARGCTDFVRHSDFPIRGRTHPETVDALPLCTSRS